MGLSKRVDFEYWLNFIWNNTIVPNTMQTSRIQLILSHQWKRVFLKKRKVMLIYVLRTYVKYLLQNIIFQSFKRIN